MRQNPFTTFVILTISRLRRLFRFRAPFLSVIFFLVLAVILFAPGNHVSAGEGPVLQPTPTPAFTEGICLPNAEDPCETGETSPELEQAPDNASSAGAVRVVLFWMEGCPHCDTVIKNVLPPLEAKYGDRLAIRQVKVEGLQGVDQLYLLGDRLGLDKNEVGVPLLLLGDKILNGEREIRTQLPGLIEQGLAQGGVSYPAVPEFNIMPQTPAGPEAPVPAANRAVIYLFWGDGCPHCAAAKPFLQELDQRSEQVELRMYEVWYVEKNQVLFTKMALAFGFEPHAVPTIFIGERYWEGYGDSIKGEIEAAVEACLASGCPDPGVGIIPGVVAPAVAPEPAAEEPVTAGPGGHQINLPLLGSIDLSTQPLFVSTLLISFVDGFNPCSVWVLTMLLALTLHTGSRKKVLLIGLIFLTVTAGIYGIFIAGLFTMFKVVSFVGWIQVMVALVALFFALVNIKDYFWYKEGVSFTISDEKKPGLFRRMRRLMDASQSFWGLVGGTIVLAAGVSLVEFSCTAGFPVLWSNLLVAQNVTALTFGLLLLVYLLIYQLDEFAIFFAAVFTMRASKLEEKHGRILKLVGGMLMLALAGVMLIDPNLMNDLSGSLIVFGAAFGVTLLILLVHRAILPKFGIQIGSEFGGRASQKQRRRKKGVDYAD